MIFHYLPSAYFEKDKIVGFAAATIGSHGRRSMPIANFG